MPFKIDEDGAVAASSPSRPIVYAKDPYGRRLRIRGESDQPEQTRRAAWDAEQASQAGPGLASQRKPHLLQCLAQSIGAANPWTGQRGNAFAEDPSRTSSVSTHESAQPQ